MAIETQPLEGELATAAIGPPVGSEFDELLKVHPAPWQTIRGQAFDALGYPIDPRLWADGLAAGVNLAAEVKHLAEDLAYDGLLIDPVW